jgi:hypothetical protein
MARRSNSPGKGENEVNKTMLACCASGAVLAIMLTACSSSSSPAAAPATSAVTGTSGAAAAPSTSSAAVTAPAPSAPAVGTTASAAATASCASQVTTWYLATTGGESEIADFHAYWADITSDTTVAEQHAAAHGALDALALTAAPQPACDDPAHAWKAAMTDFGNAGETEYLYPGQCTVAGMPCAVSPVAAADAKAGFAELVIVAHEIDMYTQAQP